MAFHVKQKGNGVLNYSLNINRQIQIEEIRLHLVEVGATSENFVVSIDSGSGDEYNCSLHSQDMNTKYSDLHQPTRPYLVDADDSVVFSYANTDGSSWGLEVVYR